MKVILSLVILGLVLTTCYSDDSATLHKGRNGDAAGRALLRKHLFSDYDKLNIPDDVTVKFGLSVLSLDTDEDKGILKVGSWMRYTWTDSRLQWDNSTNKINALRLGVHEIWKPDITLYNNANTKKDMMNCWNSNPIVYPNGRIIWIPPCESLSFCNNLTLATHPYGEQKCDLKFGSWTFDAEIMNLDFYDDEKQADLQEFGSNEWVITSNTAVRNEKVYPCCPEPYVDLTFTLGFQRMELNTCRPTKQ